MNSAFRQFILRFFKDIGITADAIDFSLLQGDGSKRIFWRISHAGSRKSFIAMSNLPIDSISRRENLSYLKIGNHLRAKGLPLPEIFQYNLEQGWFIMEDMGSTSLQDLLASDADAFSIYEDVLEHMFRLQIDGADGFDPSWCYQTERYDQVVMRRHESDYFKDAFLCRYLGLNKKWGELEGPFNHLAEIASQAENQFFLHRDFQSRNIMVLKGNIGILDWQGGRLGPLGYDLASLIIDPYTSLSRQQQHDVYQSYLALLQNYSHRSADSFKNTFPYLAIQRNLQILGAFSYLSKSMNKSYFEAYIPSALKSLRDLLHYINDPRLSVLKNIISDLTCQKNLDFSDSRE